MRPMATEFDEIHKKIGADKLDATEQKQILEKFKDHGGEVIKPPKVGQNADSTKSKAKKTSVESRRKRNASKESDKKKALEAASKVSKTGSLQQSTFFDRLSLYLNAYFSGVVTLSGKRYKAKFIHTTKTTLNTELTELINVVNSILYPKRGDLKLIKGMLIQQDASLYELLRLFKQIHQLEDFELLQKQTSSYRNDVDFILVEEPIKRIYRRLYLFWPYSHRLKNAIQYGLNIHVEYNKLSHEEFIVQLKKSHDNIHFVFDVFFLKLHYAYCKIISENLFVQDYERLYQRLHISETETVGYLIEQSMKKREESHQEEKVENDNSSHPGQGDMEDEIHEIPPELEVGMEWINNLNFIKDKVTEKDPKFYLNEDDKMLMIYVILEEFEKEFSFILTSNKINFNIDWFRGKKLDPKKELNDLYLGVNACHDNLKSYIEVSKSIHDAENDPAASPRSDRVHKLNLSLVRTGNIARTRLLDITISLGQLLQWLTEKGQAVVQNADEKLHFDTIDGKKKVEGKTSIEAIALCNSFIGYLKHLLEFAELSGSSLKIKKS